MILFSTLRRVSRRLREAVRPPAGPVGASGATSATAPGRRAIRFFFATGAGALLAFLPGKPHAGGDTHPRAWSVPAGGTQILAQYYEIQESDCRAMRAPPVVVKTRPTLGKLVVNTTTALAEQPAKCRHVKVPVTRVLYHAGSAPGSDPVGWEIFFQSRELGTRPVQGNVTVTPRTPGR